MNHKPEFSPPFLRVHMISEGKYLHIPELSSLFFWWNGFKRHVYWTCLGSPLRLCFLMLSTGKCIEHTFVLISFLYACMVSKRRAIWFYIEYIWVLISVSARLIKHVYWMHLGSQLHLCVPTWSPDVSTVYFFEALLPTPRDGPESILQRSITQPLHGKWPWKFARGPASNTELRL